MIPLMRMGPWFVSARWGRLVLSEAAGRGTRADVLMLGQLDTLLEEVRASRDRVALATLLEVASRLRGGLPFAVPLEERSFDRWLAFAAEELRLGANAGRLRVEAEENGSAGSGLSR